MTAQPLALELPRLTPAALEALRRAADSLPPGRDRVGAADILLAILGADGPGARVVDVLAPGRLGLVEERLRAVAAAAPGTGERFGELDLADGPTVALDASAREVFDALAGLRGRTADTKAILLAEAARPESLLVDTLATLGIGGPPDAIFPQLGALAARTGDEPTTGAVALVYRPIGGPPAGAATDRRSYEGPVDRRASGAPAPPWGGPSAAAPPPAASDAGQAPATRQPAGAPSPSPAQASPVTDLLAAVRDDVAGRRTAYASPAMVKRVLAAIERGPLTVVVTDSREAADELAAALADQLAADRSGAFGYRALVAVDPGHLSTQPAGALRDGLRAATGGILYLPDVPRYLDPNRSAGGSQDLRRALARREVHVLGTLSERDAGRAWPPEDAPEHELVYLEPAGIAETLGILRSRREDLARAVSTPAMPFEITDAALEAAARVADRYYRDPPPPAGALRLIQEAATAIKVRSSDGMGALHDPRVGPTPSIDADDVLLALERLTGIKAQVDDQAKLLGIEDALRERVVGQEEAVSAVADAIRRARAGLKDPHRPIGTFIFMGPSGVGKTELAKALALLLFDDERAMLRLDMSEYQEEHTVSRLLGAPPGYVGYDAGGQLTEPVRRRPYQLVLFDEIEKAHPDIHNVLLQIMDDGRLTDARGRTVDFRNTVVIMTGNVGSEYFRLEGELGREKVVEAVREEARHAFRPEFLGRVDDFIVFRSLGPPEMRKIVDIQERKLGAQLAEQGLALTFSDALKTHLAEAGYEPELGARPLRNHIRTLVERPLSRLLIEGRFTAGDAIAAGLAEGGAVSFAKAPAGA